MIYTAVCFGYSLTEEFGEHFESVDGGDWFKVIVWKSTI